MLYVFFNRKCCHFHFLYKFKKVMCVTFSAEIAVTSTENAVLFLGNVMWIAFPIENVMCTTFSKESAVMCITFFK